MSRFKVELTVYDDALREFVSKKLSFKIAGAKDPPKQAGGTVRINSARADFRPAPAATAELVGHARRGAGFKVQGTYSGWYRVQVAKDRAAFISAKDVTPGGVPTPDRFRSLWQVTPPKLQIKVPTYATSSKTIKIEGRATDQKQVKDLFVFVRNPDAKISARKIYYRSNGKSDHPKTVRFSTVVPLWPGANYISVHARENEDVQAHETVVVFRKKKIALAKEAKAAPKKPAR